MTTTRDALDMCARPGETHEPRAPVVGGRTPAQVLDVLLAVPATPWSPSPEAALHPRGYVEGAPPGFEPGMEILPTSAPHLYRAFLLTFWPIRTPPEPDCYP